LSKNNFPISAAVHPDALRLAGTLALHGALAPSRRQVD